MYFKQQREGLERTHATHCASTNDYVHNLCAQTLPQQYACMFAWTASGHRGLISRTPPCLACKHRVCVWPCCTPSNVQCTDHGSNGSRRLFLPKRQENLRRFHTFFPVCGKPREDTHTNTSRRGEWKGRKAGDNTKGSREARLVGFL